MNTYRTLALLFALIALACFSASCGLGGRRGTGGPVNVLELPGGEAPGGAPADEVEPAVPAGRDPAPAGPGAAEGPAPGGPEPLAEPWDGAHIVGRAVDSGGRPLAERTVRYALVEHALPFISRDPPLQPLEGRVRTDAGGRFRVPADLATQLEGLRLDLVDERGRALRGFAFLPPHPPGSVRSST